MIRLTSRLIAGLPLLLVFSFAAEPTANANAAHGDDAKNPTATPIVGVVFPEDDKEDAWVTEVREGGPAEKAGLKAGDTIIKFDDERIKSVKQFRALIKEHKPGDQIKLTVRRRKDILNFSVTLGRGEP